MKHSLINIALFVFIVGSMATIQAVDDHGYEHEVAKQELAKQRREERMARAAREICGENAGWSLTTNKDAIVCKTKRVHVTKVAAL
jgi:hypothetical protein